MAGPFLDTLFLSNGGTVRIQQSCFSVVAIVRIFVGSTTNLAIILNSRLAVCGFDRHHSTGKLTVEM